MISGRCVGMVVLFGGLPLTMGCGANTGSRMTERPGSDWSQAASTVPSAPARARQVATNGNAGALGNAGVATQGAAPSAADSGPGESDGAANDLVAGDAVEVRFQGVWWPAHVVAAVRGGRWEITYDGYDREWDQLVGPQRIRPRRGSAGNIAQGATIPSLSDLRHGQAVLIEWGGQWYAGSVLNIGKAGVWVRYEGYGHEWDEAVPLARLRRFAPDDGDGTPPPAVQRSPTT